MSLAIAQFAFTQTVDDALRYANQNFYGTARSSAMGGAFSSLGGDISVASTNPAGLAILRSSMISITPGAYFSEEKGTGVSGEKNAFMLPSAGFVFATNDNSGNPRNWTVGVVYNQSANFNMSKQVVATGSNYSFLDDIAYEANNPSPYYPEALRDYKGSLLPSLAYNTYLISPLDNGEYRSALAANELMNRNSKIQNKGGMGEVALSAAGNYEDILYFGATLGIQNIDFKSTDNYQEQLANPNKESLLDRFYYDKYLHTRGSGINLKLGVIYRPTDAFRLGIAVHSPTFFNLEDEYSYVMKSNFFEEPAKDAGTSFKQVYPTDNKIGVYKYDYRTPWKFTLGGSYIFGKIGLLSIDYDIIDYASAKFSNGDFNAVNQQINDIYKMTGNLKVGAEVRLNNLFSLRSGYNYFGNMYSDKSKMEQSASQYSAGLGFRYDNIFVDASYQYYTQEHTTHFKDFSAKQEHNMNTVKLTIGYKF